jgi:hypothetical protein
MIEARVEEYGSGYLIRPPDEPVVAWLRAFGPRGDLTGSPVPDLLLEDCWSFLGVPPYARTGGLSGKAKARRSGPPSTAYC